MKPEAGVPRLRLGVVGIVVVSLFGVLLARLWYLQVLASPQFVAAADTNRVRQVVVPAPRGRILDRHGRVLVDNRYVNVVTVSRALVRERAVVLGRLAALLGVPVADLERRLDDKRFSPYKPVPVAEDVDDAVLVYVNEHQDLFPGVEATRIAVRSYPYGTLAAHLLGYIGQANDQDLKRLAGRGYRPGDVVGKTGVERAYEDVLRGTPGVEKLQVDARGKVLGSLGSRPPVPGDDVVLALDADLQRLAEESLALGLEAARSQYDRSTKKRFAAPAGAVVILDPRDGSVLAVASSPTYDPARFLRPIPTAEFAALFQDPATHYPLNNRALQGLYAPGSTFKMVTAVAALRDGLITTRSTVDDRGSFSIPRCRGKCVFRNAGGHAYGRVNVVRALTVSSDVFFYTQGYNFWARQAQLGPTALQDVAREFGLGEPTGIPVGAESAGRVPDPESRRRDHERYPNLFPEGRWFPGDNVNLAIGQGELLVTPLQLANAYAAFANGGTLFAPRVATAVRDRSGRELRAVAPVVRRHVDLPPPIRDAVMSGLLGAVRDPGGTAHGAFAGFPLDRVPVAGKTGTAQVRGKQDTALFVAIAPATAPQYVVAVVLEEAGFGGAAAAPVARRILDGIAGLTPGAVAYQGGVD